MAWPSTAQTQDDPWTTILNPSTAQHGFYNLTDADGAPRTQFLKIHNPYGLSWDADGGAIPKVTVHLSFWNSDCSHRVNVSRCITLNDVDIIDLTAIDNGLSTVDLSGSFGMWTATAYETDDACTDVVSARTAGRDLRLANPGLFVTYANSNLRTTSTGGTNAIGNFVDPTGEFIDLPDFELEEINLGVYRPDTLLSEDPVTGELRGEAFFIGWVLQENAGREIGELGPPRNGVARAAVEAFDTLEIPTSLADVTTECVFLGSLDPSIASSPDRANSLRNIESALTLKLRDLRITRENADGTVTTSAIGYDTFTYGIAIMGLGAFGVSDYAVYPVPGTTGKVTPAPDPSPTPTIDLSDPTPVAPEPTPTPGPSASPEPSEAPTPTPTPNCSFSPLPEGCPTPTPAMCRVLDQQVNVLCSACVFGFDCSTGACVCNPAPNPTPTATLTPTPSP